MPAVVHACECDGGHHNHYSPQGLQGGGRSSSDRNGNREDKNHDDNEENTTAVNHPPTAHAGGDDARRDAHHGHERQQRRRRCCPETAEFDTGQISVSLRGQGEPRLIQVRMCKGCWQNFKRRSDRTLDYWAWECYPRGLLPEGGGEDDQVNNGAASTAASPGEVVIVRLARLWPAAIWGELGR